MKFLAAAAVALAVASLCAGCGSAGTALKPETITINLPAGAAGSGSDASSSSEGGSASGSEGSEAADDGAVTTTVAAAAATPVIKPLTPEANAKLNGVSVWVPYWGFSSAVASAVDNASVIKVAHPFMYEITGDSTVVDQSGGQAASVDAELADAHIAVIPTVTETEKMGAFAKTLSNPKRQTALLNALLGIGEQSDVDGIDLDFENLAIGSGNLKQIAVVETLYPKLVARLCAALHSDGRSCEVTVMAKNSAGLLDPSGLATTVYDYSALAQSADRIQIMAYDDHTPSGAAGPIAPWPWVESVLDYALTQIPAGKVVLGVPAYGYEWNSNGAASSLTATAAEQLATTVHAQIKWSQTDAEPYFSYSTGKKKHRVHHVVWFEDSTADYDRAVLAADDKLAGIALWAAGDEDSGLWSMLARVTRK